jgi:HEAT repeat protein
VEAPSPEQSAALAEFARTMKSAVRSVSLYPATHPSIQSALARVVGISGRLASGGEVTLAVQPELLTINGLAPSGRVDASVGELAALLHARLVGALRVERDADAGDWHALLTLLARSPEDLFAAGGIGRAWTATGRTHFEIREIDYAEVLRERAGGGDGAAWDRIIAFCLQGETAGIAIPEALQAIVAALDGRDPGDWPAMTRALAEAFSRLTPDRLMALLDQAREGAPRQREVVESVLASMDEPSIATFVSNSVIAERGATERLAQAFEALVPEFDRKERLLAQVHDAVGQSPLEDLWQGAAQMLMSYSDSNYVSSTYGRELSGARAQAIEIERVSDDPPDRVQAWLATVSDTAIGDLDLALLLDLLRIEHDPDNWRAVAAVVTREVERRVVLGEIARVSPLCDALVHERGDDGRPGLRAIAAEALDALSTAQMVRHVVVQLRKAEDSDVALLTRLCHAIGPSVVRPLAEALALEENNRAVRRLRELLIGFGAAGRQSVEQLKSSSNPAVRRTAIDLLRVFGGDEALPELASMLDDDDPQVQRESIRAIVQIASRDAYAVLQRALIGSKKARDTIVQELIAMRDDKTAPLLGHVLDHTSPSGALAQVHVQVMEALGGLTPRPETVRALRDALYRGSWWAPLRTATLRQAAAAALRRIGTSESLAVLEEAAARGNRGVRNAARPHAAAGARRERRPLDSAGGGPA